MQQARIDRFNRSLVVRSQIDVAVQQNKIGQLLNTYLTSLFFVSGIVRIVQTMRYVSSFIFSHQLFRRRKNRNKTVEQISIDNQMARIAEREQEESRLKDNFLSMASHELKTPMTTILGQAQLMKRRLAKIPELSSDLTFMHGALESIDSQTRRLNSLVDDLLDLYNIRAGKIELHVEPCDLISICHDVVREQRLLTGRSIQLDVPTSPVIMQADAGRLSQVIANLANNALRYSPENSTVQMFVDTRRDVSIIEVCDAGSGIPQEEQTHIFEPFYRSPNNVCTSSKNGLGLGLSISKDIIEQHGGRIWCRSRLGQGSTFIVEIPIKGYISRGRPLSH